MVRDSPAHHCSIANNANGIAEGSSRIRSTVKVARISALCEHDQLQVHDEMPGGIFRRGTG